MGVFLSCSKSSYAKVSRESQSDSWSILTPSNCPVVTQLHHLTNSQQLSCILPAIMHVGHRAIRSVLVIDYDSEILLDSIIQRSAT